MFMLTKTHTAAVKSLTDDLEEARDEIAKLKGARRIDGLTVEQLQDGLKRAEAERSHWKAKHASVVTKLTDAGVANDDLQSERDGLKRDILAEREKFKAAARDLAAQSDELARLRPIAERAMQKAANDAARKRERRAAAPKPVAAKVKRGASK